MTGLQGLQCLLLRNDRVAFCPELCLAFTVGIAGLLEDAEEMFALTDMSVLHVLDTLAQDLLTVLTTFPDLSTTDMV